MSKTLYLIDAHAHVHAAYHAIRILTSPSGEPTNAVYGFVAMLLKIIREKQPDALIIASEGPEKTFRHERFPDYKATRKPIDEDLVRQFPRVDEVIDAMGLCRLDAQGFEADDVIAAAVKQARKDGYTTVICSRDKDLEQLLAPDVILYDTKNNRETTVETLWRDRGVTPRQVPDLLGLMGDTSDNLPGVPGIGPKTASKLIEKYGSIEGVYEHLDALKGKQKENLAAARANAELSRELARLCPDVPIEIDFSAARPDRPDPEKIKPLFEELGFTRFLAQLGIGQDTQSAPKITAEKEKTRFVLVDTEETFEAFLAELKQQDIIAVDTETTSIRAVDARLVGMSFSWQPGLGYYLPLAGPLGARVLPRKETLKRLQKIIEDPDVAKCGQNIKYDMTVFKQAGIDLKGVRFDTMLAAYVLDAARRSFSLDALAEDLLDYKTIHLKDLLGTGKKQVTFDVVDTRIAADYAAEDAEVTWRLRETFDPQLDRSGLRDIFEQVEMPLVPVLARMEQNGVALDTRLLKRMSTTFADRMDTLRDEIFSAAGRPFNIDSPKQLAGVLFDELKLPVGKLTGKSARSTDAGVLAGLAFQHEVPRLVLAWRELAKLKNTYVDPLPAMISPKTGRLHASFNQTGTVTGRLSSSNPNLQNIPIRGELGRLIRTAFVPGEKDHVLLRADYSQIELRMLAHLSRDANLRAAFEAGKDIHRVVAAEVFGVPIEEVTPRQRDRAKGVNFGIIYGQTAFGLARGLGISQTQAAGFIERYHARYPGIRRFLDACIDQAKRGGYVQTIKGRRRPIPEINSQTAARRAFAERTAINSVVQGSAADLIKLAMIDIDRHLQTENLPVKMVLQVHDELVFELPADRAETDAKWIAELMTHAIEMTVPLTVDPAWGPNWLEAK